MRVFVVHTAVKSAADTGLFGASRESRLQLVEVTETAQIHELRSLTKEREVRNEEYNDIRQDFELDSISSMECLVKNMAIKYHSEVLTAAMCLAIMFRLCT